MLIVRVDYITAFIDNYCQVAECVCELKNRIQQVRHLVEKQTNERYCLGSYLLHKVVFKFCISNFICRLIHEFFIRYATNRIKE